MSISLSNSEPNSSSDTPTKTRQEPTRGHYRRRDFDSTLFTEDLATNSQALHRNGNLDSQPNSLAKERDREILNQNNRDEEILDTESTKPVQELPQPIYRAKTNTNLIVPKEDKYYLIDEDGDIIKEPS